MVEHEHHINEFHSSCENDIYNMWQSTKMIQKFSNFPTNIVILMLGWMVMCFLRKQTKITFIHTPSWAYLFKKMKNECKMNNFFLPQLLQLHVAPHNPCPLTNINVHWKCVYFFQKIIFLHYYHIGNYSIGPSLWPTCFDKKSNFDTRSLLCISILVQTLNFILCTLPSTPTTNYAQGKLCNPCIWKQWFISCCYLI
jgi:hypothetical protein